MSTAIPGQVRSLLGDLLQIIEKTSRAYRAIVLHARGSSVRHPQVDGWPELCELASRTATQASELLEGIEIELAEDCPPPLTTHSLAARLNARRTVMSAAGIPRPRLH